MRQAPVRKLQLPEGVFTLLKNKMQPSKLEDLIGLIKGFVSWAAPYLASRESSHKLYKMESFYRQDSWARKLLISKRKEKGCSGQDISFWRGRT